jgi:sn-glycerol 3-phosphate transport system ATP-binding protein
VKNNQKEAQENATMNNAMALELSSVVKTYDNGHKAIRDISLSFELGEFVVLVGPSGCGKSSLLRCIAGLEDLSAGEVTLHGIRVDTLKPAKRDIAMVFQNYALYPHMSVYDNLAYGLKNRGVAKADIERKILHVAKILKIEEYLQRKPAKLSGGQRQRVAMGRAIVRDPKLFLFDEPLSNLDAALRTHMRLEIKKLHRKLGVTSVYVTHDQVEALTLADRIVVLNQGCVEQVGTPMQVYRDPQTKFVASFIGSPAMNFIDIELQQRRFVVRNQVILTSSPYYAATSDAMTLGVRPEACSLSGTEDDLQLEIIPEVIEPLGSHYLVHARCFEQMISFTLTDNLPQLDQPTTLYVNPNACYLFDQHDKRVYPTSSPVAEPENVGEVAL